MVVNLEAMKCYLLFNDIARLTISDSYNYISKKFITSFSLQSKAIIKHFQ